MEIDQSKLAGRRRHQKLRPSTLLVLAILVGRQRHSLHLESERRSRLAGAAVADAGRQWRRLGGVDRFQWIAKRHNIRDRTAQFEMATKVVGSIASTITTR